jgi:glycine C-acetyltransferase
MSNPVLQRLESELEKAREIGNYKTLHELETATKAHVVVANVGEVLLMCSNDYQGFAAHPAVVAAARTALERYGVGPASVRFICGTLMIHEQLERKIAEFLHAESAITYSSCWSANTGLFPVLAGAGDVVISDALNHASIIDGCRLSRASIKVFPHKDVAAARRILETLPAAERKLLITDGVFSMDGDLGSLPALCALAEEFGCIMMVDDAHASGVFGQHGRGTVDHFNVHGRVDVQVGTLSKAFGALGGYVAGSRALIDVLCHRARPLLFSTSHPPAVAATCIAAIDVLLEEPEIIDRLWDNTRFFKSGLQRLGFNTGMSDSPITPVIVGNGALAMTLSDRLFEEGVFAQGIAFPTVADDKARVRTIVTATHTRGELQFALEVFEKVGRQLRILPADDSG